MKLIAQVLVVILVVQLLAPLPCLAQQTGDGNVGQLREQIARLEKIDSDPEISPEVKAMNREFLEERRARLNALVGRRVSALRQYLAAAGDALNPRERQAVEDSIRALAGETRATRPAAGGAAPSNVQARAAFGPSPPAAPALYTVAEPAYSGSLLSPPPETVSVRQNPGQAPPADGKKDKNTLEINTNPPTAVPTPLEVRNKAVVTVMVTKSVVNKCEVATKREELKPEPNPIGQLLKILFGLGTIPLASVGEQNLCKNPVVPVPDDPEARRVEAEIATFRKRLADILNDLRDERMEYERTAKRISAFANCTGRDKDPGGELIFVEGEPTYAQQRSICKTPGDFDDEKASLLDDMKTLLKIDGDAVDREPTVIESAELQMASLKKAITDGYKKRGGDVEAVWIDSVNQRLDCLAKNLEVARKGRAYLQNTRGEFEAFYELLKKHKGEAAEGSYKKVLIADSNAKLTGTVTCTNYFTKQAAFDPIPFTVTYQPFSPHALTGGVLFSTLGKRQIGGVGVRTGTGENSATLTRVTIAETDTAEGQVIPFSFYNYRFLGGQKFGLNATGGVGVNPNNGTAQVEFFAGGALNIRNVFVQLGGHFGRWQDLGGGLTIGDLLPAGVGAPPLPIERRYTLRPAVGVSYKLPLP
ncbi:MAG TPA: hypothetical protein VGB98_06745 [Pyrinomonadaceae bacterium]